MHRAHRAGRRPGCRHGRGPGARRRTSSGATGVPQRARPAVRLLHARHGDGRGQPAQTEPEPDRRSGARRPRRQPVPVHGLPQHRPGCARGGSAVGRQPGRGDRMIPAAFDYIAADSAADAVDLLARHGDDAKLLAGGHSLLPMMKLRLAAPPVLIDISRARDLSGISIDGGELVIGATTRHADLASSELVKTEAPLLAHADPAADLPMALVALGGSVELTGPAGSRRVAADDFFTGFFETTLADGELLSAVRVPRRPGAAWGYQKFVRRANDWAIVGVAAIDGRIALANMASVPIRARAPEEATATGASPPPAPALGADGTSPR